MATAAEVRAGGAFVQFYTKGDAAVQKALANMQARLQNLGRSVALAGAGIASVGAAITAPFIAGLTVFTEWGEEMRSTIRQTGIEFEQLDHLMDGMRVSGDEMVAGSRAFSNFIVDALANPAGQAAQRLSDLGVSAESLSRMSPGDRMLELADAISRVGDENARIEHQTSIFGKGGQRFDISGGRAGIAERAARVDQLEGVQTPQDLALAQETSMAFREMKIAINGLWREIGAAAAPAMRSLFGTIINGIIAVREFVTENRVLFSIAFRVAGAMVIAGTAIGALGGVIYGAAFAFSFLSGAIGIVTGLLAWLYGWATFAATGFGVLGVATTLWGVAYSVAVSIVSAASSVLLTVLTLAWAATKLLSVGLWFIVSGQLAYSIAMGIAKVATVAISVATFIYSLAMWKASIATTAATAGVNLLAAAFAVLAAAISIVITGGIVYPFILLAAAVYGAVTSIGSLTNAFRGFSTDMASSGRGIASSFEGAWAATTAGFSSMFATIVSVAGQSWQGIKDAFAIGEWQVLWEILKTAALLVWEQIRQPVQVMLNSWKDFFVDTFTSIWTEIKVLFEQGWTYLKAGWFDAFAEILVAWQRVQSPIARALWIAANPIHSAQERDEAQWARDREDNAAVQAVRDQATETRTQGTVDVDTVRREARLANEETQRLRRERDAAIASADTNRVAELESELGRLAHWAEEERLMQDRAREDALRDPIVDGQNNTMAALTRGTFSASAASGFAGGSAADRAAATANESRDLLRQIRDRLAGDNLVMG